MASQNLVSAVLPPELKNSIVTKLSSLKSDFNFLISILPGEKNEHVKVGNVMLPLLDMARDVVATHPEIISAIFDKEEFIKDYQLTKDLAPISTQLMELAAAVETTLFAANSDAMVGALEVYAAVLQNEDKVPGLDVIAAQMREFFKRPKRLKAAPKQ